MNVVMEDGTFQGSSDDTQVRQQLSDLENIIMEGDIILNIHDDDGGSQKEFQIISAECAEHSHLDLHQDETLVKFGDKFESHKDFLKYVNEHSKKWCFYYKCTESKDVETDNESYTYNCVFLRNRDYKRKGVKKRFNFKTDCPCKVKLRRKPGQGLMVTYVCNHHDHELSNENFNKIQQNRKLPPYIKEIIMDLLALEVEVVKIRKLVEIETGVKMSRSFFYEIERKMKLKNEERLITDKRLKELSNKMSVVDEMYSCDEDENTDDQQAPKNKRVKISTPTGIISKFEEEAACEKLEESLNKDMQSSSWMDQSAETMEAQGTSTDQSMNTMYTVKIEEDGQTYEIAEDGAMPEDFTHEYTVDSTAENTEHQEETDQEKTFSQLENVVLQDEYGNIINNENIVILQQDENGAIQDDQGNIGYFDGEQIIFMPEGNQSNQDTEQTEQVVMEQTEVEESEDASNACDVSVQTSSKSGSSYVPVFDVYMKNGNVTGFLVNDEVVKDTDKSVASLQDSSEQTHITESMLEQLNEVSASNATQEYMCGDIYTKHEYIHRYNIDSYMSNPRFPKYIDTLAKKTRTDVLRMLTRVYSEKAMFKMTTTQKGKEGNTKIWYLTDVRRKGKYKMSDEEKMKKDKLGQYITDILILKERVKLLKKDNEELVTRNKYLEEVALRLAKMRESN